MIAGRIVFGWMTLVAGASFASSSGGGAPQLLAGYGNWPLAFEPNRGQADARALFVARPRGGAVLLEKDGVAFGSGRAIPLRMRWTKSDPAAAPAPEEPLPGKVNYLLGQDPRRWVTRIPTYRKIRYRAVQPGIDLVFRGDGRLLEYDWELAPGAEVDRIALVFEGVDSVSVAPSGALVLVRGGQRIEQSPPRVFERGPSGARALAARFALRPGGRVGVVVEGRSPSRPLLIDPSIAYATYLGGSGFDTASSIAVDDVGSAYLTGWTTSLDFPVINPLWVPDGGAPAGSHDSWIVKLDPNGQPLFSTYLGGSGDDYGNQVAVDSRYRPYIVGSTGSNDFPVTANALETRPPNQNPGENDGYITQLSADGSALLFSTYWGGTGTDIARAIAVDGQGTLYVAGSTDSTAPFPILNAYQATPGGTTDGFLSKLIPDAGSFQLAYSTYLGGSQTDSFDAIAVDAIGNAFVAGYTVSPDFPTLSPLQALSVADGGPCLEANTSDAGVYSPRDAMVAEFDPLGRLVHATYLGGTGLDSATGIAVDGAGNAYVTGYTASPDFPVTSKAYQDAGAIGCVMTATFATKFLAAPRGPWPISYSTYVGGGTGFASGRALAVDRSGRAYLAGVVGSTYPVVNPLPNGDTYHGNDDIGVSVLDPSGSNLLFSSFLGGSGADFALGVAIDVAGNAYLAGYTHSTDFPAENAYQPNGSATVVVNPDAVVAKLILSGLDGGAADAGVSGGDAGRAASDGGASPPLFGWSCASAHGLVSFPLAWMLACQVILRRRRPRA